MRCFDMSVLGKFAVVMADPPWDIHMELPYGTMSDDEMRSEINKFFDKLTPIIESVEEKFTEYRDELLSLKNV